jgi:dTDP-glucose pyrophosphorylase
MKALILAGGRGRRLTELTKNKNKSMLKIWEKPLIEYNLDQAVEAGVSEIIIVVGYRKEEIIKHIGKEYKGIKVGYVVQKQQRGLVNAIETAKESIGDSDFVLMLADEVVVNAKLKEMIRKFRDEDLFAVCGVVFEEDKHSIGRTYTAMVNEKGRVFRLIEKPKFSINKIKGTGHCVMKNEIFEYIDKTPISMQRGEKELVDMIQCAVDEGKDVRVYPITDNYVNVNTPEDLDSAKELIKRNNPRVLIVHTQMKFFGGAELLIVELCNWLTREGIENDILALSKSKEVENSLINTNIIIPSHNIDLKPPGFKSTKDILNFIKLYREQLRKLLKDYDVINFHNFPVTWALWPRRKPCVWMLNEPPNLWSRPEAGFFLKLLNKLRNYIDREIVRSSVDIICVADEFNKERCKIRYKKNPRKIYYGVNYDFFSKGNASKAEMKWNPDKKFVVLQSGMLTEVKNQLESIEAVKKVRGKIPNILLVLAGKEDETYRGSLKEYIKRNKLEKYVLFTGNLNREKLRDLYKAADVGLFPVSKQGGWLTPFEMLCAGKPVIVSKDLGAASIIKRNKLGIVTENYAKALIEIRKNKNSYKKRAKKAALFIKKNLSWKNFAEEMIKAYKDALKMHS